jgi:hypothetical protein
MGKDIVFLGILAASLVAWTFVTAEFAADVKRFEHWLISQFPHGRHVDPDFGTTGPQPQLPEEPAHPRYGTLLNDTPAEGTERVINGQRFTVGAHPYPGAEPVMGDKWLHEVRAEREAFCRPDIADLLYDAAQREGVSVPPDLYDRFAAHQDDVFTDAEREALFAAVPRPENPSPSMLPITGDIPRIHAADVYGETSQLKVAPELARVRQP